MKKEYIILAAAIVALGLYLVLRNEALESHEGWYSGNLGHADDHILVDSLPAGRYYVQVYHRSSGSSSQAYHLQINY